MYRMEDEYTNDNSEDEYTFIMYKISPKNSEIKHCYIGHTTNFTPFYISNADFYIVLNHIKIIYNSFLFFLFYSLEHIFLVFHKHP